MLLGLVGLTILRKHLHERAASDAADAAIIAKGAVRAATTFLEGKEVSWLSFSCILQSPS
jgi:hypothetical protein